MFTDTVPQSRFLLAVTDWKTRKRRLLIKFYYDSVVFILNPKCNEHRTTRCNMDEGVNDTKSDKKGDQVWWVRVRERAGCQVSHSVWAPAAKAHLRNFIIARILLQMWRALHQRNFRPKYRTLRQFMAHITNMKNLGLNAHWALNQSLQGFQMSPR